VLLRKYNDDILSIDLTVEEKVLTGYAKLNINTRLAASPLRGNVGVPDVKPTSRGATAPTSLPA